MCWHRALVLASCLWAGGALPLAAQAPGAAAQGTPGGATGCVTCHAGLPSAFADSAIVFRDDIHRERGFQCSDCHGGNAAATTKEAAHDRGRGYRGAIARAEVIGVCARCHSDAAFMRGFAPALRVDQAAEYATSRHGKRLAEGDAKVAVCSSCHHAHGIRRVRDPQSPVYPLKVASTCAACHGDENYMRGYQREDGTPLPTTQHREYEQSVHHQALTNARDLSAPTCNDCHGNHGAAPPAAGSVVNVCGTCHSVFATRMRASVHGPIFDRGCIECHGNHGILPPSEEMLGATAGTVCAACHENDPGAKSAAMMRAGLDQLRLTIDRVQGRVTRLREAGMEVGAQELALREARTQLTLSRTEIHTFDAAAVDKVVAAGMSLTSQADVAAERAAAELRFRRRGLAVSMIVLLVMVAALVLKIRQIERAQNSAS